MAQVITAERQEVVVGSKVDQFISEMEKDEATRSLLPEVQETINYKGTQLLIKSRVIPAGVSRKTKEAYDAFTTIEVFRPGKVVNGHIKPVGKAYLVYGKDEDGNSTEEIIGYRLRLKGHVKGGSVASTKEVKTPCFGLKFKVESRFSEKTQKDYVALIDEDESIVGFCNDYYEVGMDYSYKIVVMVK